MSVIEKSPLVVPYVQSHLADICRIEFYSYELPWSAEEMENLIHKIGVSTIVFEYNDLVFGFAIYRFRRNSIQLLNLAVEPEARRAGVGTNLIDHVKSKKSSRHRTISTVVQECNLGAQLFLKEQRFFCTEIKDVEDESTQYKFVY